MNRWLIFDGVLVALDHHNCNVLQFDFMMYYRYLWINNILDRFWENGTAAGQVVFRGGRRRFLRFRARAREAKREHESAKQKEREFDTGRPIPEPKATR
jgi:hypothetical protein